MRSNLLPGLTRHKWTNRVRPIQYRQDLLDIQSIERTSRRQRTLLMADVQRAVVEPDICLDGDGADGEGLVEGDLCITSVHDISIYRVLSPSWPGQRTIGPQHCLKGQFKT